MPSFTHCTDAGACGLPAPCRRMVHIHPVVTLIDVLLTSCAQDEFSEQAVVPIKVLPHGEAHRTFVVLTRPEGSIALGRFVNVLRFTVKEIDPSTGASSLSSLQRAPSLSRPPQFIAPDPAPRVVCRYLDPLHGCHSMLMIIVSSVFVRIIWAAAMPML